MMYLQAVSLVGQRGHRGRVRQISDHNREATDQVRLGSEGDYGVLVEVETYENSNRFVSQQSKEVRGPVLHDADLADMSRWFGQHQLPQRVRTQPALAQAA